MEKKTTLLDGFCLLYWPVFFEFRTNIMCPFRCFCSIQCLICNTNTVFVSFIKNGTAMFATMFVIDCWQLFRSHISFNIIDCLSNEVLWVALVHCFENQEGYLDFVHCEEQTHSRFLLVTYLHVALLYLD